MNGDAPLRVPPSDIQAEGCVLGSMMLHTPCIDLVRGLLKAEEFYRPAHQALFEVLCGMASAGEPVDLVTVRGRLATSGLLERVGGVEYVVALVEGLPTAANAAYYARCVREKAILRKLIVAGSELADDAYAWSDSVADLLDVAEKRLLDIDPRLSAGRGADATIGEAVDEALAEAEKCQEDRGTIGLASGLGDLDAVTGRFRPGENVVLAGRTGAGKSALAITMALAAARSRQAVVYVSGEMPTGQIGKRFVQAMAGVFGSRIRNGQLRPEDWEALKDARDQLHNLPAWITGRKVTIPEVRAICRRAESRFNQPARMVVLDTLQLMRPHEGRSRYEQVSAMSTAAKELALEQPCVVVTISQMDRASVKGDAKNRDPKPTIFSLKESGSIENDADFVLLMHAPGEGRVMCPHDRQAVEVYLRIGKGRETTSTPWIDEDPKRGLHLRWYPGLTRMADWGGPMGCGEDGDDEDETYRT